MTAALLLISTMLASSASIGELLERASTAFVEGRYAECESLTETVLDRLPQGSAEFATLRTEATQLLGLATFRRGDVARAEALLDEAVLRARTIPSHTDLQRAAAMHHRAHVFIDTNRFDRAESLLEEILAIYRRELGDDHPETATAIADRAFLFQACGDSDQALVMFREALRIDRALEPHDDFRIAASLNNLAWSLEDRGDYAAAEPLYREALARLRRANGDDHPLVARAYVNLGHVHFARGEFAEAERRFREGIELAMRTLGASHPDTRRFRLSLGQVVSTAGEPARAIAILERVVRELRSDPSARSDLATALDALGGAYVGVDRPERAGPIFEEALRITRRTQGPLSPAFASQSAALASLAATLGDFEAAVVKLRQCLSLYERTGLGMRPINVELRTLLAQCLDELGRDEEARTTLDNAAGHFELVRRRMSRQGIERAVYDANTSPHPLLAAWYAERGDAERAWSHLEAAAGRGLLDALEHRRASGPRDASREDRLDGRIREHLGATATPRDDAPSASDTESLVLDGCDVANRLSPDQALMGWLDVAPLPASGRDDRSHWVWVLRRGKKPAFERLTGSGKDGAFTPDDRTLPMRTRRAMTDPAATPDLESLARQRIDPARRHLAGVRHLVVVPAGIMVGIPIETLVDDFHVSYVPSGTLFARLVDANATSDASHTAHPASTASPIRLLAVGAPSSGPSDQSSRRNDDPLVFTDPPAKPPLPFAMRELAALSSLASKTELLTGRAATEENLRRRLTNDRLREFDVLHFATHAVIDSNRPFHSALLLARDPASDPVGDVVEGRAPFDGRLAAAEVLAHWTLDADLVTLSACETGLGRRVSSEGHLGFAQAFLVAGARNVLSSLWKVDDRATAMLMERFYDNALRRGMHRVAALDEAKRWLRTRSRSDIVAWTQRKPAPALDPTLSQRTGTSEAADSSDADRPYAHPFYWAGFVLLGAGNP